MREQAIDVVRPDTAPGFDGLHSQPRVGRVMRDAERERELFDTGFTVVPFLETEQARALQDQYYELARDHSFPATGGVEHHVSFFSTDETYRRESFALLCSVFEARMEQVLIDYQPIFGSFVVKQPGGGLVQLHTDLTTTAKPDDVRLNVWFPLTDVDDSNGALRLVPGSHRLAGVTAPRGSCFWGNHADRLRQQSVSVPLNAGQAIVYFDNTLHWSPPNQTDTPRVAVGVMCAPRSGTPAIYRLDEASGGRRFEMFDMSDGGFYEQSVEELFVGTIKRKSLGFVANTNRLLSWRHVERVLSGESIDEPRRGLLHRLIGKLRLS